MMYRIARMVRHVQSLFVIAPALIWLCFPALAVSGPAIPSGEVRIHYFRPDGNYSGWALYTWNASTENAIWCQNEVAVTGTDS